ncbi:VCBS repeat-containing protein [Flavihumibacter sp. R14]|nr:VCBS repeat-containing protein [Flavihumibacter soli]
MTGKTRVLNLKSKYFIKIFILLFGVASVFVSCKNDTGKFVKLSSGSTNIDFTNTIPENDTLNIFDFANIYNGGGVGVGDFNNDGNQDLYFTGNMVPNKLYLNKGKMQFEDVTRESKTDGNGVWSRGVAVVDINNDGKLDMYVCATAKRSPKDRINLLYVNQGVDKDNIPVFKDMAAEYGLADTTQSTMAYFFDYDNDQDLDLYIGVNHIIKDEYANKFKKRNLNGEHPSTSKLYRNDWDEKLNHPVYTDVSRQAGILIEGYTHAVNIFDANDDGWLDIFEANDYISNNVLYINNHDGTFTDHVMDYFKHAAANSMGTDAVDLNNDGLEDIVEVDMAPQDNFRKKMFQNPLSYQMYQNSDQFGYQYQYTRNMVQANQGPTMGAGDSIKHPVFSDVGFFAGIAETDWSWTPLVGDYDSDGFRDILFTNGFPKDITDHDFIVFRQEAFQLTSKKDMLSEIPEVKIHNYVYKNNGQFRFSDKTMDWGLEESNFSNGAVYADLDNDGDMDVVINNINDPASVYENRIVKPENLNYLNVNFKGSDKNINGLGTKVTLHQKSNTQTFINNPFRGYISSVSPIMHFGLVPNEKIDSVEILWPGGLKQVIKSGLKNQLLTVDIKNAQAFQKEKQAVLASDNLFTNITSNVGVSYVHQQRDYVDFNIQKLLPHKFTEYSPGIAVGDINGDKLDDFITGGAPGFSPMVFTQNSNAKFTQSSLMTNVQSVQKKSDDRGVLLFDADGDGDLDLYTSSGGYIYEQGDMSYSDALYINNGKGKFTLLPSGLPVNNTSKFSVRAADFDRDGDLDLFIAGRVDPHFYPKATSSFIYRNDSQNGKVLFTDVTKIVAPALQNIGLTCDAVFSDFNNDGWPDILLAGEWMSVKFLLNKNGKFVDVTSNSGVGNKVGWWNSITPGDFDNDGDIDYVAGNIGLNSFYRATDKMPVSIRAKDFDNNGSYDAIPSLFLPATLEKNAPWLEFPAHGRDDMVKQIIGTRIKFQNYNLFANSIIDTLLPPEKMKDALKLSANYMASAYLQNDGGGHFTMKELPLASQVSVLNGMVADDFDNDGNLDICINTNDYGTDPNVGRYDALNGLVLRGDGKGGFLPLSIRQSGIFIKGNGKGLSKLKGADNTYLLAATQNKGPIQIYKTRQQFAMIDAKPDDMFALLTFKNGKKRKVELYYGASFLSQSSRFFAINDVKSCIITNSKGSTRSVTVN